MTSFTLRFQWFMGDFLFLPQKPASSEPTFPYGVEFNRRAGGFSRQIGGLVCFIGKQRRLTLIRLLTLTFSLFEEEGEMQSRGFLRGFWTLYLS
jgi:hypothetical protein